MSESESGGSDDDDQTLHVLATHTEQIENTDCVYLWFVYRHAEHYRMHLLQGGQCSELETPWREMCDSACSFHIVCLHYEVLRTAVGVMNVSPDSITELLMTRYDLKLLQSRSCSPATAWSLCVGL